MKIYLLLISIMITLPANGNDLSSGLDGCMDPNIIVKALTELHKENWRSLTLDHLWSIWPTELSYKDCSQFGCESVWSMDRIINSRCQCCALFTFKKQGTEDKPHTEWLSSIIIYYTSPHRSELIDIAKRFASALGIESNDLKKVGSESKQNFFWETQDEVGGMKLHFEQVGQNWKLYLNSGQNILK